MQVSFSKVKIAAIAFLFTLFFLKEKKKTKFRNEISTTEKSQNFRQKDDNAKKEEKK